MKNVFATCQNFVSAMKIIVRFYKKNDRCLLAVPGIVSTVSDTLLLSTAGEMILTDSSIVPSDSLTVYVIFSNPNTTGTVKIIIIS